MKQVTKVKHISMRFAFQLETEIGSYKITLIDRKDGTREVFQDEIFNNALIDAHRHFITTMKEDKKGSKKLKKLNQPVYL